MSTGEPGAPVRRHLMTPGRPRPPQRESMSLGAVQRWVMSTLAATTIMHLAAGIVIAAYVADGVPAQVGLLVISGAFGILAFVAALLIHHRSLLSWWLLPGLLPPLVGAWVIFG